MKRALMALVLCFAAAGCSTTITPEELAAVQKRTEQTQAAITQTKSVVAKVQSYTSTACKFLPTAATITSLFNAGIGATIEAVGGAICNAITTAPLADGGTRVPYVNGVAIRGDHLK